MDHACFATPKAQFMNTIGLPCGVITASMPLPEALYSITKGSLKFGKASVCVHVIACLRDSNVALASSVQSNRLLLRGHEEDKQ